MRGLLFDVYCKFFVTGHSVAIKLLLRRTLVLGTMKRQVMKIRLIVKTQDAKRKTNASIPCNHFVLKVYLDQLVFYY